jgi:hypothetical protein
MSNVLVIEPRKILQHAIAIALFPDHEARIVEALPQAASAHDCNAVIIDAVALREMNALSPQLVSAMGEWNLPLVWIDGDVPEPPKSVNLVVVKRPVTRDQLRAALATCLERQLMLRASAKPAAQQGPASSSRMIRPRAAASAAAPQLIELVDVVEEAPAQSKDKK